MFFSMFSNGLPVFPPAAEFIEFCQEAKSSDRDNEANLSPKAGYGHDPNMIIKWIFLVYIYIYILFLAAVKYRNLECLATCNN